MCPSDRQRCGRFGELLHAAEQTRGSGSPSVGLRSEGSCTGSAGVGSVPRVQPLRQQLHPHRHTDLTAGVSVC